MMRWGRWGGALTMVAILAMSGGCGQLFAQGQQPVTLTQLNNRIDSLDAQVGELQAAIANMGSSAAQSAGQEGSALQSGLPVAVVQADVLNVRSEPSLSGTIVGTLLQNTQVNVVAENGNWSEISYTNPATQVHLTGWVDSDFLGPVTAAGSIGVTKESSATATARAAAQSASGTHASATSASGAGAGTHVAHRASSSSASAPSSSSSTY